MRLSRERWRRGWVDLCRGAPAGERRSAVVHEMARGLMGEERGGRGRSGRAGRLTWLDGALSGAGEGCRER